MKNFINCDPSQKIKDMIGKRFGLLVVQKYLGKVRVQPKSLKPRYTHYVEVLCDCGNKKEVSAYHVLSGDIESCRCLHRSIAKVVNRKHGQALKTKAYSSWAGALSRCNNPKNAKYYKYGGRGISVCESWHDFRNFYEDMGDCPEGHTLHRINNDGNYEPGNCKWADAHEQSRQKTNSVFVTLGGIRMNATDAERQLGWGSDVICGRLRAGWTEERALSQPPTNKRKKWNPWLITT